MKLLYSFTITLFSGFLLCSCTKDWLDKKQNQQQVVPVTVAHYQAILDYNQDINRHYPIAGVLSADEMVVPLALWQSYSNVFARNAYIWAKDIQEGTDDSEWEYAYERIYLSNVVMEGIESVSITAAEKAAWENVKGSSYFIRGFATYAVASIYSSPYLTVNPATTPGVPLHVSSDVDAPAPRGTLAQTYQLVIDDLKKAALLLPTRATIQTRPCKLAAWATLSRVYLSMGKYEEAEQFADSCLKAYPTLMDYNTEVSGNRTSFEQFNKEVLFWAIAGSYAFPSYASGKTSIDSNLYRLYEPNDLRLSRFFNTYNDKLIFTGTYSGSRLAYDFVGIANDEVYLIRAECRARRNEQQGALQDLNVLLKNRWATGLFSPVSTASASETLDRILLERRKELIHRGLRWYDLRRLNPDPRFATTLKRKMGDSTYILPPNDPRYTFQLPEIEVRLGNLEQNIR